MIGDCDCGCSTSVAQTEEDFALYRKAVERLHDDDGTRLTGEEVFGAGYTPVDDGYKPEFEISLIVMSGVLIIGFAACRRHDISGRQAGGQGNGRRWPSHTDQGPVSSVMLLRG